MTDVLDHLGISLSVPAPNSARANQTDLAWVGMLDSHLTGQMDGPTRSAISRFSVSLGGPQTNQLTPDQRRILSDRAAETSASYGFDRVTIPWVGASAILPRSILVRPQLLGDTFNSVSYSTHHGANLQFYFDVLDRSIATPSASLSGRINILETYARENDDTFELFRNRAFSNSYILEYRLGDAIWFDIGQKMPDSWRFLRMRYDMSSRFAMMPVVETVLRGLDLAAFPALSGTERIEQFLTGTSPEMIGMPDWFKTMVGNGSGSIVSRAGHILTNAHVVAGCRRVTVNGAPATVLGSDARIDLALVQSERFSDRRPVRFRVDNPRLGEAVSVMGYPIFNTSQSLNYTRGYVSSAVGYRGDRMSVQITAPVQPGNSGGPVFDNDGRQIAVVASKATSSFQASSNAENVAWVIRGRQAIDFLALYDVSPIIETRPLSAQVPNADDIAEWRQVTVRIECHDSAS